MEILSVDDAVNKINIYLSCDNFRPYFVISDGAENFKKFFGNFEQIYISEFCQGDFFVDSDLLIDKLKTLQRNALFFGLGEYIFFTAQENILRRLQDKIFNKKIIFVCRGIANLLERLADEDFKFRTNHICRVAGKENFSVVKYGSNIKIPTDAKNFSELLKLLESGKNSASVQTDLPLVNVKEINTFFDVLKNRDAYFNATPDALNDSQWQKYFFDENCEGYSPEHWRSFAAGFKNKISNPYLRFVFSRSANFETYQKNLFFALLDVEDEKNFEEFYAQRKAAIKNISSPYLAEYLERLKNFPDALKYLTDNTSEERRVMIQAVQGKEKIPALFEKNFPAMKDYLTDYDFNDTEITNYFRQYKKIKLCNLDDENFKNYVTELALSRPYNKFETRQKILEDSDSAAKLYWLDALGAEFASYIKARALQLGLSIKIKIARADLPTLTFQNKNFYDEWRGSKFAKNPKLDELKHSPESFDAHGKCSTPTYIDEEFKIIDSVISEIKNSLANRRAKKIILTSDHGTSRLAVMFGREIKFKMHSEGEHGGRCCLANDVDEKPLCAVENNGWWILANYDRFSGGRISSLEVHGGATLEEILVPVIEFSLPNLEVN